MKTNQFYRQVWKGVEPLLIQGNIRRDMMNFFLW